MKKKYYLYELNAVTLNLFAFILLTLGFLILILAINCGLHFNFDFDVDYKYFMILLVPYFVLHEIFHFIGYTVNCADPKRITFGIHLEKGVLCCSCKQKVSKKCILWSLMYPFLFLGVFTLILGFLINNSILILLSICNIAGAAGDILMFFEFIRIKNFEYSEYDNPLGFALVSNEDLSKRKMIGMKYISTENKVECHVDKKIDISKKSYIYLLIWFALCLIYLFL